MKHYNFDHFLKETKTHKYTDSVSRTGKSKNKSPQAAFSWKKKKFLQKACEVKSQQSAMKG